MKQAAKEIKTSNKAAAKRDAGCNANSDAEHGVKRDVDSVAERDADSIADSVAERDAVALDAVNEILKSLQAGNCKKSDLREQLKLYVLAKFDLMELANTIKASDDFDAITQKSIDKAFAINPELAKESLRSATCDGASTLDTKQALLMMAIQKDFNVKLDTMRAALASSIDELADVLIQAIKSSPAHACGVCNVDAPLDVASRTGGMPDNGAPPNIASRTSGMPDNGAPPNIASRTSDIGNSGTENTTSAVFKSNFDCEAIRAQFPALKQQINGHPLVYLDSAASMQMPEAVIETLEELRSGHYSNVHRGAHTMSQLCSESFDAARAKIAKFLDVSCEETIFTFGTSDSINKAAGMLRNRLNKNSNIVTTQMEHHSNLLPWINLTKETQCELRVIPVYENGALDMERASQIIDENTAIVTFTQLSNVSGISNPCKKLSKLAKKKSNAVVIVDGAQGVVHASHHPKELGCDMYVFSGHKLGSITGIGILWVKSSLLETLTPCTFGGGTVDEVSTSSFTLNAGVERFEAGTPPIDGAISLAAAIDFWKSIDEEACAKHEKALIQKICAGLESLPNIKIFGDSPERIGCVSFAIDSMSSYKCAQILDCNGIATRSGRHCAQSYLEALGFDATVRASIASYNNFNDVDTFLEVLQKICNR